jgi:hypothetical protein
MSWIVRRGGCFGTAALREIAEEEGTGRDGSKEAI